MCTLYVSFFCVLLRLYNKLRLTSYITACCTMFTNTETGTTFILSSILLSLLSSLTWANYIAASHWELVCTHCGLQTRSCMTTSLLPLQRHIMKPEICCPLTDRENETSLYTLGQHFHSMVCASEINFQMMQELSATLVLSNCTYARTMVIFSKITQLSWLEV